MDRFTGLPIPLSKGPIVGVHDMYGMDKLYVFRVKPSDFPIHSNPTEILQKHNTKKAFGCEVRDRACHCEYYYYHEDIGHKMIAGPKIGHTAGLDHEGYCHIINDWPHKKISTIDDSSTRGNLAHLGNVMNMYMAMDAETETESSPSSPKGDLDDHFAPPPHSRVRSSSKEAIKKDSIEK